MSNEKDSLSVTSERVRQVFSGTNLVPQQRASLTSLLDKALARNGDKPIPVEELEGIKELVTEHIWHPALTQQLDNAKLNGEPK